MAPSTNLDEKFEGADNFRAWKYRVMLVLEEKNLEGFIEVNILEAKEEKLGDEDNQALAAHARKGKNKVEDRPLRKF